MECEWISNFFFFFEKKNHGMHETPIYQPCKPQSNKTKYKPYQILLFNSNKIIKLRQIFQIFKKHVIIIILTNKTLTNETHGWI